MYLISIYFDEETDNRIRSFIKQIAKHTGNRTMLEGNVPPHITVAAFQTDSEVHAKEIFRNASKQIAADTIQWVSVGTFFPGVIYITPVLNEYLNQLSVIYNKEIMKCESVQSNKRYQPFHWIPHSTLAKHLTKEQMQKAFEVMQNQFGPFKSRITKVGLAKTNPYIDIELLELK